MRPRTCRRSVPGFDGGVDRRGRCGRLRAALLLWPQPVIAKRQQQTSEHTRRNAPLHDRQPAHPVRGPLRLVHAIRKITQRVRHFAHGRQSTRRDLRNYRVVDISNGMAQFHLDQFHSFFKAMAHTAVAGGGGGG